MSKVKGYRNMLGYSQEAIAKEFGITKQAYNAKERGRSSFTDREKLQFRDMLKPMFPNITIDDIFFN